MALPVISTPEFFDALPSTNEEIKYRPFLVGEEKSLLIAMEGQDQKEISNAILNLLKNCLITDLDINKLATFDIEYLFLKIRGKSVGEVINVKMTHTEGDCEHRTEVQVNLDDIKVQGEVKDSKVMITDEIGVALKYPTLASIMNMKNDGANAMFTMICENIEYIYDSEQVYSDFSQQEIEEWVNGLGQAQFRKITEFFEGIPKLSHTVEWKCPKCGKEDSVVLEGLQSFFT